jgi:hypothetical protein
VLYESPGTVTRAIVAEYTERYNLIGGDQLQLDHTAQDEYVEIAEELP